MEGNECYCNLKEDFLIIKIRVTEIRLYYEFILITELAINNFFIFLYNLI